MTSLWRRAFGLGVTVSSCLGIACPAPAAAAPECTDIAPNTRMCSRAPGQTAIVTSPNPALTNPYPGWGFGTLGIPGIGIGGGGIWIGF